MGAKWESPRRVISGGSPWTRQAIAALKPDELAAIHKAVPDGTYIVLGAERKPGNWVVRLMQECEFPVELVRVADVHNIVNGVRAVVHRWRTTKP